MKYFQNVSLTTNVTEAYMNMMNSTILPLVTPNVTEVFDIVMNTSIAKNLTDALTSVELMVMNSSLTKEVTEVYLPMYDEQLQGLSQGYRNINLDLRIVAHCYFVAMGSRHYFRDRYVLSYWAGFLTAFGGGTYTSFLLGVPPAIFVLNSVTLWWTVMWYLVNYAPYDLFGRIWKGAMPLRCGCKVLSCITRASNMMSRCDLAVARFPGVVAAPLFLGTVAGTGGRFTGDVAAFLSGTNKTPMELESPTWVLRSAVLTTLSYTLLVHWLQLAHKDTVHAVFTTLLMLQAVTGELLDRPVDPSAPFATLFHRVTRIPVPAPKVSRISTHDIQAKAKPDPAPAPAKRKREPRDPSGADTKDEGGQSDPQVQDVALKPDAEVKREGGDDDSEPQEEVATPSPVVKAGMRQRLKAGKEAASPVTPFSPVAGA